MRLLFEVLRLALQTVMANKVRSFLTAVPPRTGIVATVRADGRPHAAPVWYAVDEDGSVLFNTGAATVKGRNLARSGWAALRCHARGIGTPGSGQAFVAHHRPTPQYPRRYRSRIKRSFPRFP